MFYSQIDEDGYSFPPRRPTKPRKPRGNDEAPKHRNKPKRWTRTTHKRDMLS